VKEKKKKGEGFCHIARRERSRRKEERHRLLLQKRAKEKKKRRKKKGEGKKESKGSFHVPFPIKGRGEVRGGTVEGKGGKRKKERSSSHY